jgi:hypothetical protein
MNARTTERHLEVLVEGLEAEGQRVTRGYQ